jgi:hypothetical protein
MRLWKNLIMFMTYFVTGTLCFHTDTPRACQNLVTNCQSQCMHFPHMVTLIFLEKEDMTSSTIKTCLNLCDRIHLQCMNNVYYGILLVQLQEGSFML